MCLDVVRRCGDMAFDGLSIWNDGAFGLVQMGHDGARQAEAQGRAAEGWGDQSGSLYLSEPTKVLAISARNAQRPSRSCRQHFGPVSTAARECPPSWLPTLRGRPGIFSVPDWALMRSPVTRPAPVDLGRTMKCRRARQTKNMHMWPWEVGNRLSQLPPNRNYLCNSASD